MQKRNPKTVFLLHFVTLGIYLLVWCAKSKKEVNKLLGRNAVPTLWWFLVPLGCYWWMWLYAEAMEQATTGQIKRDFTFGVWLVTTLFLGGGYSFRFPLDFGSSSNSMSAPVHINWAIAAIVVGIVYLVLMTVVGIFPTVMQTKINKLNLPDKTAHTA